MNTTRDMTTQEIDDLINRFQKKRRKNMVLSYQYNVDIFENGRRFTGIRRK